MLAIANAVIALGVIVVVGRVVMRPLFRLVASVGMSDLFVATTLFVIVATGVAGVDQSQGLIPHGIAGEVDGDVPAAAFAGLPRLGHHGARCHEVAGGVIEHLRRQFLRPVDAGGLAFGVVEAG